MRDYHRHYSSINDLSAAGRQKHWGYYEKVYGPWLPDGKPESVILDVGCGAGLLMEWLKTKQCGTIKGVDADAGQIAFAQWLGLDVEQTMDIESWISGHAEVSLLILKDVLEHLEDGQMYRFLSIAAQRLKGDGKIILSIPNANHAFGCRWRYNDVTHERSYTELSVAQVLTATGLQLIYLSSDDVWTARSLLGYIQQSVRRMFHLWRRLEATAEFGMDGWRMPLGLNLIAVAVRDDSILGR
jgi:2-polyprenyl-3-methyl-5-hydroxy-6-metoxy-1,4-benzoquinol methylase